MTDHEVTSPHCREEEGKLCVISSPRPPLTYVRSGEVCVRHIRVCTEVSAGVQGALRLVKKTEQLTSPAPT